MMKNSEWGAVLYLAESKYGKNEEIWINNSSSYITGSAGSSASAAQNVGTTNDYTSTQGQEASTTGNVYGIYDMSGAAYEYVAAYVNNENENSTSYVSSLVSAASYMKDVYAVGSEATRAANYAANSVVFGDTVYETSSNGDSINGSWHGDCSYFPNLSGFCLDRGGGYSGGSTDGAFFFSYGDGSAVNYLGFRPVLISP